MKLAALFSGGKDSVYALHCAKQQDHSIECLVTIHSTYKNSYMYHLPNIQLTELSAQAMDLPLLIGKTSEGKEKELGILKEILLELKEKIGINGIVSGALASEYQKKRVDRIAFELGLKSLAPLWHCNQLQLLEEMLKTKLEIIIVGVYAAGLNENWLGRKLDWKSLAELKKLKEKFNISLAGEGGEFETLVTNAPFFKKRIKIKKAVKKWDGVRGELEIKKAILV